MFTVTIFAIAKTQAHPKCPSIDDWLQKTQCMYICHICRYIYIYIYTPYTVEYFSTIKNEILSFAETCMDLENNILNEVSQTEKTNIA